MEIQYLKYFVAVARHGKFAKAALACRVSQPALSVQIKKLEDELGVRLFVRSTQKVSLTREGHALLPRAQQVLDDINELSQSARTLGDHFATSWIVGITPAVAYSSFFKQLSIVQKIHKSFMPSFRELAIDDLLEQVRMQTIDVAALPVAGAIPAGLSAHLIDRVELVAIHAKGHPVGQSDCIGVHASCGLRSTLEKAAQSLGASLSTRHIAHHTDMLKHWVSLGLGWSIIPMTALTPADRRRFQVRTVASVYLDFAIVGLDNPRFLALVKELSSAP